MLVTARKPRGLLLTFEGLPHTVLQSQVGVLADWLSQMGIAEIDVLAVACSSEIYRTSLANLTDFSTRFSSRFFLRQGLRPAIPGAMAVNQRIVARFIREVAMCYKFIHARTDYAAVIAGGIARRLGIPMIWDCRGDGEQEFLLRTAATRPQFLVRSRGRQIAGYSGRAARNCAKAIFVTDALREKAERHLDGKPARTVPSLVDAGRFGVDLEARSRRRKELGIAADAVVWVYSGSLNAYQGFTDALALYRSGEADGRNHLLVLTPEVAAAETAIRAAGIERWSALYAPFAEMPSYLNAADVALMLRPTSPVNVMAFPTKFAEFGAVGLLVALNRSVPAAFSIAEAAGNLFHDRLPVPERLSDDRRRQISRFYLERYSHDAFVDAYRDIYRVS